jgi:DNA-binding transcriptional LysR family regulator
MTMWRAVKWMPEWVVSMFQVADADVAAGRLVRVLPRWSTQSGYLWLVRPGARVVPRKVSVFVDFLLESLRVRGIIPRAG